MTKPLFVILISLFTQLSFSQKEECTPILQKDFVDKIQGYDPMNLVPYNVNNDSWEKDWGLMDRKTKKKLTAPLMSHAGTFNANLTFFYNDCDVKITNKLELLVKNLMIYSEDYDDSDRAKIKLLDSINGFKGFEVDSLGNLTGYSQAYYKNQNHYWNISTPFLYQNNYYAIVENSDGNSIIINTKGEAILKSIYKAIVHTNYQKNNEDLLYVEDLEGKRGFITLSGSKFLYGELLKYPFNHNDIFGYSIQHDGNNGNSYSVDAITQSGILDLTKMEWLIKPTKGLKMFDMVYASNKSIKTDAENRKLANIYFIVSGKKMDYLIDEKNNKYIAK